MRNTSSLWRESIDISGLPLLSAFRTHEPERPAQLIQGKLEFIRAQDVHDSPQHRAIALGMVTG
jgi:hypothetical protein